MFQKSLQWLGRQSPWIVFLPFGLLYIAYAVLARDNSQLVLDEFRYWGFAENLLNGHFHFREGDNFLWSGPGYPISIVPFVAFNAPLALVKAMNGVWLYLSVVFLCLTFRHYFAAPRSFLLAFLWAAYAPFYEFALPLIMTEGFTAMLVCATIYTLSRAFQRKAYDWKGLALPAFCLAFLVLTKVIFGYVVVLLAALFWLYRLLARVRNNELRAVTIGQSRYLALAMAFLLPYLIYTFSLTGKPLYWGNAGGLSMYWMASPYEGELGDWHVKNLREHPQLKEHHAAYFASLDSLSPVDRDAAFKQKAVEWAIAHPKKYAYNAIANLGRTFFSYPLSFLEPSNGIFKYLIPHIFLLVPGLLFLWPTLRHHRKFPAEMMLLLAFMGLYLAETILVSSYVRFFMIVIPILLWWVAFATDRFVKVDFGK